MLPQYSMSSDYSSSPTLFYPRPQSSFFPQEHALQSSASQCAPVNTSYVAQSSTRPSMPKHKSRKRSRDDASLDTEDLMEPDPSTMEVAQEPVYGEGMTLLDPKTGRALAAESQTGTWYEENIEIERKAAEEAARSLEQDRLEALGRAPKTVRLDSPSAVTAEAHVPLAATTPAPEIDQVSLTLGVGWKAIGQDQDMAGAARGWARYIENHYPLLGGIEIVCKSAGLEAFLVKALQPCEGWWLFKDDLTEGRLVATTFEACVANLRSQPVVFEGLESTTAAASPGAAPVAEDAVVEDAMMM